MTDPLRRIPLALRMAARLLPLDAREDVAGALDFGNAYCALAHTIEGDVAHVTSAEVEALLREGPDVRLRR